MRMPPDSSLSQPCDTGDGGHGVRGSSIAPWRSAKGRDKAIRTKTIRHTDCIEVGHDKFDEMVTNFLQKVSELNIIGIHPLTYTHLDIGSQKLMTEYAVMIVYRG